MAKARVSVTLSQDFFRTVTNHPAAIRKASEVANRIAAAAVGIAAAEEVDTVVTVQTGTRPGGRGYARVTSSNADAEHGTAATPRRRVLGRAAGLPYKP